MRTQFLDLKALEVRQHKISLIRAASACTFTVSVLHGLSTALTVLQQGGTRYSDRRYSDQRQRRDFPRANLLTKDTSFTVLHRSSFCAS
jgi:hypothetical protein